MAVKFLGDIDVIGSMNITSSDVPNLDASKITGGTFDLARIPDLSNLYALAGHTHNFDNYQSWNLRTNGVQRTTIQSGGILNLVAGANVNLSYSAGGTVTINSSYVDTNSIDYVSNVSLNGNSLDFTGVGNAFNSSVDLASLVPTVETIYATVKNVDTEPIEKGTPLAVVAGQTSGNVSDVVPARANNAAFMPAVFIANESIAPEAEGQAIIFGKITGIDTHLYASGDTVYVGPTGGWTTTKPTGTNLIQNLGVIIKAHDTNGAGIVMGAGRANAVPNIPNGQAWVGNASGVATPTTLNLSNWDTAYGWGDHSVEGYLTAHPTISGATSVNNSGGTVIQDLTFDSNGHVTGTVSANLDGRYYTETEVNNLLAGKSDTTHTHSAFNTAINITSSSDGILNLVQSDAGITPGVKEGGWNYIQFFDGQSDRQAYIGIDSDGDIRISAEVPSRYIQFDNTIAAPNANINGIVYAGSGNSNNWNTAYGWGDHSVAGYLASSSYTASDVLNKIKTVDGSGSGLDADTVDGLHAGNFLRSDVSDQFTGEALYGTGGNAFYNFVMPQNPEGKHIKAPWFFNDIAYARLRGATIDVQVIGGIVPSNTSIDAMLDASTGFWNVLTTGVSEVIIEMNNLPKTFYHGSHLGVTFGNTTWRARSVRLESFYNGQWNVLADITGNAEEFVNVSYNSGSNAQTQLRWTFSDFNSTSMRIVSLYAYNYNAAGMPSLYLTKDGGEMYGDIDMGTNVITDAKVGNWDTAYAWGNHASAGYLTSLGSAILDGDFTSNGLMKRTGAGTYAVITDNSANWTTAYNWGNHASAGYLTALPAHTHPISEIDGLQDELDGKQPIGSYAPASHTHAYLPLAGGTLTGALVANAGITGLDINNGISGNNFNISGVNQLTINDPGEGIMFTGTNNVYLYAIDDATDNKMNFGGASELQVNGSKVATESWVGSQGYLTSVPTGYATEAYVTTSITNLIDSAPGTLNTLNELAAALGDDPNFATTISTTLAGKMGNLGAQQLQDDAHPAGASEYTLELYSPDTGDATNEMSIRFHQGNQYWGQLRYRAGGFRFTGGNDDNLTTVSANFSGNLTGNVTGNVSGSAGSVPWAGVTGKPTTFTPSAHTQAWSTITSTPTTLAGYGITDAATSAQGAKADTALQSYTETDTLASVTARGGTTTSAVNFAGSTIFTGSIGNSTTTVPSVMIGLSSGNDPQIQFTDSGYNAHIDFGASAGDDFDVRIIHSAANTLDIQGAGSSGLKVNSQTVWNAGNDGAGSGLDADTLDGLQATAFGSAGDTAKGVEAFGWGDHAGLYAASTHTHVASDITSGTFDGARLPWLDNDTFTGTYPIVWSASNSLYRSSWLQVRGLDDMLLTRGITADGVISATGGNSTNWNTAYSWGNHAGLYAAASHNHDSVYVKLDGSSVISNTLKISSGEMGGTYRSWMTQGLLIGGGGSDGAYFGMRVDGANAADTVIAWGDDAGDELHFINTISGGAAEGVTFMTMFGNQNTIRMYKQLDVQETIYATGGNSTEWNQAYAWGDHSTQGYITDGNTNWNNTYGFITASDSITGNAATATKLATARNIALTGAVTGNANFDGSGNISIATTATSDPTLTINGDASGTATFTNLGNATLTLTIADDSHNHTIANVDGLQTALNTKLTSTFGVSVSTNDVLPALDRGYDLGRDDLRYRIVFCETLDSAGIHESNLAGGRVGHYATGTVLVWEKGVAIPCTSFANYMKIGVAVYGNASPLVHGAEPVLCTGQVEEGDYLVTSTEDGHAMALTREEVREKNLMDCVIGKALESGDGKSHLIKTWLTI